MAEPEKDNAATAGVFLSYSRSDAPAARQIQGCLKRAGVATFLDRDQLPAGQPWLPALERALADCAAVAVLVGPTGLGTWQQREVQLALDRQADAERAGRPFPVIPVLLPNVEDPPGGFLRLQTWVDLRSDISDPGQLHLLLSGLRGQAPADAGTAREGICPYRGLLAFREEDAGLFFGREDAVGALLDKLHDHSVVTLVGRSGSGKSSVVSAGLIPALRRRADGRTWSILTLRPGGEPLHALVRLFDPPPPGLPPFEADQRVEQQVTILRADKNALARRIRSFLAATEEAGTDRLLLYVDQWEELWTQALRRQGVDHALLERDVAQFINLLLDATRTSPCTAVLTLRADFYGEILKHGPLAAAVTPGQVNLGPLSREGLSAAISKPAEAVSLTVDPSLLEALVDEVWGDLGKLPLLEYALKETWRLRDGQRLTLDAYGRAGGINGAVARRANQIFASLSKTEQAAARRLFVSLVTPGDGREQTRARAVYPEDDEAIATVINKFSAPDARLLVTGEDAPSARRLVELSHEAMIREWDLLKDWVEGNREVLRRAGHVRTRMRQWEEQARDPSLLLPAGLPLEEGRRLLADHGDVLIVDVRPYIVASIAADEERRKQAEAAAELERQRELTAARRLANEQAKRARIAIGLGLVALLLAAGAGWQWRQADRYAAQAEERLGQAIGITEGFVNRSVQLSDRFGIPRDAVGELLTQADEAFEQLLKEGATSLQVRSSRANQLMVLADHYRIIGKKDRQEHAANEARRIVEDLAAQQPSNPEWRRQLAVSHDLSGDILADEMQLEAALAEYRAARTIRERLLAEDAGNQSLRRDLSISDNRIGDLLFRQGHPDEALAHYRQALTTSRLLAHADPSDIERQRDVLIIQQKLGDALVEVGDRRTAEDAYQLALALAEHLAGTNPGNTQLQWDLATAHEKIGHLLEGRDDLSGALDHYQLALAINALLAANDPANVTVQDDLALDHENVGRILADQGEREAALEQYRQSLDVRKQLADIDPSSTDLQKDLLRNYDRVGDLLQELGRIDEAKAAYQASLAVAERLAAADPDNAEWQYLAYRQAGRILECEGNERKAYENYCQAKSLAMRNSALSLSDGQWRKRLDWLEQRLAIVRNAGAPC